MSEDLTFRVPPARIVEFGTKKLRSKVIPLVKVAWCRDGVEDFTWEREEDMRASHPELF